MARETGGAGAVSLLFTPASAKVADGQKGSTPGEFRSMSGLGRTPASAGRSLGAAGATPSSRRRSLTPSSTRQVETPLPPPADSLLDSPGGLGVGAATWLPSTAADDMQTSMSPQAAADRAAAGPMTVAGHALTRAAHAFEALEDTWVTVFGFNQADMPLVIREFSRAGDILQFGTFGDGAGVNWVHMQFSNKHAAHRALLRNGEQLSATCMVGVKPLDTEHRAALQQYGSDVTGLSFALGFPKSQQQRPYTLESLTSSNPVVPLATKGLTQRIKELVLGF